MYVAPKGCEIKWTGPNGYHEIAKSQGLAQFPMILFSREDWGEKTYPFLPLCGEACYHGEGRDKLFDLFPLQENTQIQFQYAGSMISLVVNGKEKMPLLNDTQAYRVDALIDGIYQNSSWWSETVGWIVKYKDANFEKSVYSVRCETPTS